MKQSAKYLIAAILWSAVALFALYVLFFASTTTLLIRLAGILLIAMCLSGQWVRYFKSR